MATAAQDMIDAIDDLIYAKLSGASDLSEVAQRRLGELGIAYAGTIESLRKLRLDYLKQLSAESGGTEETTVYV